MLSRIPVLRSLHYRFNQFLLADWPVWSARLAGILEEIAVVIYPQSNAAESLAVKVFCQVKDDSDVIEDWIKWHTYVFGYSNVVVISDSPSQVTKSILAKYSNLLTILEAPLQQWPEGLGWDEKKTENLTVAMRSYSESADFLIPLDADEFVSFEGLPDRRRIFREFSRLMRMQRSSFKFYTEYHSCSLLPRVSRPAVEITDFRLVKRDFQSKKCFAKAKGFRRVGLGQHYIYIDGSRQHPLPSRLSLIHFSWRGLEQMRRKCWQNAQPKVQLADGSFRVPRGAASLEYLEGARNIESGDFIAWATEEVGKPNKSDYSLSNILTLIDPVIRRDLTA